MLVFGLISTSFDLMTFYIIYRPLQASVSEFRTAWFMESLLTELLVVMVLRTKKRFYQSRPSRLLLGLTIVLVFLALAIPFIPLSNLFGFVPLRMSFLASIVTITLFYLITTESVKNLVD